MKSERKEHFARGLNEWLADNVHSGDATLWIDMQVTIGLMTRREAHEFEKWLGGAK